MNSTVTEARICTNCLTEKPLTEFRLRSRNGSTKRQKQCRACHNFSERLRLETKREKSRQRDVGKHLTQLSRARSQAQVQLLCSQMLDQFGGVQGFIDVWSTYQQQAIKKGGFGAYRCIKTLLQMIKYCQSNANIARPDVSFSDSLD
jgi:hypothetical protein